MILWKLEHKTKTNDKTHDHKGDQAIDQQIQYQEGAYEKVMVMLKINKLRGSKAVKNQSKKNPK